MKATPTVAFFDMPDATEYNRTYSGNPVTLSVPTLRNGYTGAGEVTVKYNGSAQAPVNAGSYAITLDVAEGQNFNAASGLPAGTLVIGKAPSAAVIATSAAVAKGGNTVSLMNKISGAEGTLSFAITGAANGCAVDPSTGVFTSGDTACTVTVRVTEAESANRFGRTANIIVEVSETAVTFEAGGTVTSWDALANETYLIYDSSVTSSAAIADATSGSPSQNMANVPDVGSPSSVGGRISEAVDFSDVPDGDYTVTITKPGKYVPKAVEVTVDGGDADFGTVNLWLYGDVTNDGQVTSADVMAVKRHIAGLNSVFDAGTDQDKADREAAANITAVTTGDDEITSADVMQINRYIAGLGSAFDAIE